MSRPLAMVHHEEPHAHASSDAATRRALVGAAEALGEALAQRIVQLVLEGIADANVTTPVRTTFDRNELAATLGISLSSLDRLRAEPGFPELRIGDAPRFIVADVLDYLRKASRG